MMYEKRFEHNNITICFDKIIFMNNTMMFEFENRTIAYSDIKKIILKDKLLMSKNITYVYFKFEE